MLLGRERKEAIPLNDRERGEALEVGGTPDQTNASSAGETA